MRLRTLVLVEIILFILIAAYGAAQPHRSQFIVRRIVTVDGRYHMLLLPALTPEFLVSPAAGDVGFPGVSKSDILTCFQVVDVKEEGEEGNKRGYKTLSLACKIGDNLKHYDFEGWSFGTYSVPPEAQDAR